MNKRLLLLVLPLVAGGFYLRSLASWRPQKVFVSQGGISQLVFSEEGHRLLILQTAYAPRPVAAQLSLITGSLLTEVDTEHGFRPLWTRRLPWYWAQGQFVAHDKQIVVSEGVGGPTLTLDAATGQTRSTCHLKGNLAFSPDGQWLVQSNPLDETTGSVQGRALLFHTATKNHFAPSNAVKIWGQLRRANFKASFSPDGKTLALGKSDESGARLELYEVGTWKLRSVWTDLNLSKTNQHAGRAPLYTDICWSRNGELLLSSWEVSARYATQPSRRLRVWRARDGKPLASSSLYFMNPALQNDGSVLVREGNDIVLHSLPDLDTNTKTVFHQSIVAAVSPDSSYIVAGNGSGVVYRKRLK